MSDIKDCFVSRFENGIIINADYSQLEIIALAHLSGDVVLKNDLMSGKDLHTIRAAELFSKPEVAITPTERKLAKAFSFQLQYGAGPKSMAESNDVPIELAKKFIKNYYDRYPRVASWQARIAMEVKTSRRPSTRLTKAGSTAGRGVHVSPTGRRYAFYEEDIPFKRSGGLPMQGFSPTKMKNYPVQGFATGDIVPMMLGELFEWIQTNADLREDLLLINTVHDSVMFDCNADVLAVRAVACQIKKILENAPQRLEEYFGIEFDLPLKVDIEVGKSWGALKKLDI